MGYVFDDIHALAIAATVAFAMVLGWLVGRWVGHSLRVRSGGKAAVSKFLDASLAVPRLLLAFTFSTALVKHDQRRLMVVADANEHDIAGTVCFIALVSAAIFVTLDLNQPNRGFITVDQEPIARLLSSMPQ
jgi:ABC-type antimicrobial peptide transport system permease subunit